MRSIHIYNISLYLPYESMYSFYYGPKIIQQLVKIFEYENFTIPIVVDNDNDNNDNNKESPISCLQCIWYQSVTKERLLKYYNVTMNKFEFYETYMPSYTKQHHDYTIQELRNYANKYQTSDKTLYDIIQQLPIHIHKGISNTKVSIEQGVVVVKPNEEKIDAEQRRIRNQLVYATALSAITFVFLIIDRIFR